MYSLQLAVGYRETLYKFLRTFGKRLHIFCNVRAHVFRILQRI